MATARKVTDNKRVLVRNVDSMVLYGSNENIRKAVELCITVAGGHRVLNFGHVVEKDSSETAVAAFVNAAKQVKLSSFFFF